MLHDLNNSKTKAIIAAAREMDALHRIWLAGEFSMGEVDLRLAQLQSINAEEFNDSGSIQQWLGELRRSFEMKQQRDSEAGVRYEAVVANLDSEKGFMTVFI